MILGSILELYNYNTLRLILGLRDYDIIFNFIL